MRTPEWNSVIVHKSQGFTFVLSFEKELRSPKEHFINDFQWTKDEYSTIKDFYWFCAKVTVYKGVVECGTSYVGACCFKSKKEALGDGYNTGLGGCLPQMIEEALEEANKNLTSNFEVKT